MTFTSTVAKYALPVALVATFATNANAAGLIPGQCYAKADAEAVLKQEGQMPMIMGNRLTDDRNANIIFVNKQGYGYNIEGNARLGQKSTELCVAVAFKNTILNSPTNPDIPSFARDIKPSQSGVDLQKAYENGGRVVLGARTYTPQADGSEKLGKRIIVIAGTTGNLKNSASVLGVDSLGNPSTSLLMDETSITNNMVDILTGKVALSDSSERTLALK